MRIRKQTETVEEVERQRDANVRKVREQQAARRDEIAALGLDLSRPRAKTYDVEAEQAKAQRVADEQAAMMSGAKAQIVADATEQAQKSGRLRRAPDWSGYKPAAGAVLLSSWLWSLARGFAPPGGLVFRDEWGTEATVDAGVPIDSLFEAEDLVGIWFVVMLLAERSVDGRPVTINPREARLFPRAWSTKTKVLDWLAVQQIITFEIVGGDQWRIGYGAKTLELVEGFERAYPARDPVTETKAKRRLAGLLAARPDPVPAGAVAHADAALDETAAAMDVVRARLADPAVAPDRDELDA